MSDDGNASKKVPTADDLALFLHRGTEMMLSDETRQLLMDREGVPRPGKKLIELQRAGWDALGVDRDVGCKHLDQLDHDYPENLELRGARDTFVTTAMETYLKSLHDRRPERLETVKPMPRALILEFFDACNTKMGTPSFQEALCGQLCERKTMPNQMVIDAQRDLLEVLGFEREHGCKCLSNIVKDYPDDAELLAAFQRWQQHAHRALMLAVKKHQAQGGELPNGPFNNNPELKKLEAEATAEIEQMSPVERGELVNKMQKKFEVFMNLPPDRRESYCKSLSHADKLEFAKGQILILSVMRQQWEQGTRQCEHSSQHGEAAKPAQQQMM